MKENPTPQEQSIPTPIESSQQQETDQRQSIIKKLSGLFRRSGNESKQNPTQPKLTTPIESQTPGLSVNDNPELSKNPS